MIFDLKNIGKITKGSISLSDITIITGENNTGKTYATYSIYGLLMNLENNIDEIHLISNLKNLNSVVNDYIEDFIINDKVNIEHNDFGLILESFLSKVSSETTDNLHTIFKAEKILFTSSKLSIKGYKDIKFTLKNEKFSMFSDELEYNVFLNKTKLKGIEISLTIRPISIGLGDSEKNKEHYKVILSNALARLIKLYFEKLSYSPLIASSERSSISLFYKQLDESNSHIINSILNRGLKQGKQGKLNLNSVSKFALPVKDNIDKVRSYYLLSKNQSYLYKENLKIQNILRELVNGVYEEIDDHIYYIDEKGKKFQLHTVSSSIKSLFLIDFYIKNLIEKNKILIIDEPESNLHPNKQILMAQLIVELALAGVKILLTTHSDYLLREINNCIMASNLDEYYHEFRSPISSKKVKAYVVLNNGNIEELTVHKKYGLDAKNFDEIISAHQNESVDIYEKIK